jgi:hypothetical protein
MMALRLRLLRSPASLDVGDAEGGIVCRCNRRVNILEDTMHFFHCPSSQGQFICRRNHIRDAIMDQIGDSVDNQPGNEGPHIEVEWEPLMLARAPPMPEPPPSPPRADGAMEVEAVVPPPPLRERRGGRVHRTKPPGSAAATSLSTLTAPA